MDAKNDRELLVRVTAIKDFVGRALLRDDIPDWQLAEEYGAFLSRIGTDDVVTHLLLAKAHRHLGESQKAAAELARCREIMLSGKASQTEIEALSEVIETEERLGRSAE